MLSQSYILIEFGLTLIRLLVCALFLSSLVSYHYNSFFIFVCPSICRLLFIRKKIVQFNFKELKD
jgi:hypothetical protein